MFRVYVFSKTIPSTFLFFDLVRINSKQQRAELSSIKWGRAPAMRRRPWGSIIGPPLHGPSPPSGHSAPYRPTWGSSLKEAGGEIWVSVPEATATGSWNWPGGVSMLEPAWPQRNWTQDQPEWCSSTEMTWLTPGSDGFQVLRACCPSVSWCPNREPWVCIFILPAFSLVRS